MKMAGLPHGRPMIAPQIPHYKAQNPILRQIELAPKLLLMKNE